MKPNSATYRAILDSFWTNVNILDLLPEEKLFYLWSFTNSHLDTCGCYQVSVKTIAHETGFTVDQVMDLIDRFTVMGKIKYCESTKELLLLKWKKNNAGFFKPENKNSIKSMLAGASKIKAPELRSIVMGWLNNESEEGSYQGGSEAPYLPPTQGANEGAGVEGSTQPLTINHKPVTLKTKSKAVAGELSFSEKSIRAAVEKLDPLIREKYPGFDIEAETAELVAKYRDQSIGNNAEVIVLRWFKNLKKKQEHDQAPPPKSKAEQRIDRNILSLIHI